ncbi:hypothetical protein ABK040_002489 [Willaertia magna]
MEEETPLGISVEKDYNTIGNSVATTELDIQNDDLVGEVSTIKRCYAILCKTIAEESNRPCMWILQIIVALIFILIPSIMSIMVLITIMNNPNDGNKYYVQSTSPTKSFFSTAYFKSNQSPICCNEKQTSYSYYSAQCPTQNYRFAVNVTNGSVKDKERIGFISSIGDSRGMLRFIPHQFNQNSESDSCEMSPLITPNESISYLLENTFKGKTRDYQAALVFSNTFSKDDSDNNILNNMNCKIYSYSADIYETMLVSIYNASLYYSTYGDGNITIYNKSLLKMILQMRDGVLKKDSRVDMGTVYIITLICIPVTFALLLPIFIHSFSADKASEMMKIIALFGVKRIEHDLVKSAFYYLLYLIYMTIIIVIGCAFQIQFFLNGNVAIYIFSFLIWGITILAMAHFIVLFSNKVGFLFGYIFVICSFTLACALNISMGAMQLPFYWLIFPPIAFVRLCYLSMLKYMIDYTIDNYSIEIGAAFGFLIAETILMIIAIPLYELLTFLKKRILNVWARYQAKRYSLKKMEMILDTNTTDQQQQDNFISDNNNHIEEDDEKDRLEDETVERERKLLLVGDNFQMNNSDNVVEVRNLTKVFGDKVALNSVSLSVKRGTCFGLLGNNGAGKSTFVNCLNSVESYSGSCKISGDEVYSSSNGKLSNYVGYVPQFDNFFNITLLDQLYFFARIKGIKSKYLKEHVESIISEIGLVEARRQKCHALSGGMKRRLTLAMALLGDPKLLIVDEISSGLDPLSAHGIHELLKRFMKRNEKSIILLTHSMEEVELLCDKIAILVNGEIKSIGTIHELKSMYGKGFILTVDLHTIQNQNDFILLLRNELGNDVKVDLESIYRNRLVLRVIPIITNTTTTNLGNNKKKKVLERIFNIFSVNKKLLSQMKDWSIMEATLEEVFIRKVKWQYESTLMQ